jgi:ABC-2 type transport system ATP-binding protein
MSTAVIRTLGLTKHFGPVRALDGLDLTVDTGDVFGFLGPNGAGKSTAIFILLDLLRPTSGTVEVLGRRPSDGGPELRSRIGYLPGELRLPGRPTAGRYLNYLARLRGGRGADKIEPLADRFDLDLHRPIGHLSKGNKQKVGLVQAFMHRPELLVLDEPTSGLDPLLQHRFQDLVRDCAAEGTTVFMSSHVLSEIEEVAGRVGVIRAGKLVDVDDLETLRHRAGQRIELRFAELVDGERFRALVGVHDLIVADDPTTGRSALTCTLRGDPDELLKVAARYRVLEWKAADRELDDLFLEFYRDQPNAETLRSPQHV